MYKIYILTSSFELEKCLIQKIFFIVSVARTPQVTLIGFSIKVICGVLATETINERRTGIIRYFESDKGLKRTMI